MSSAHQVITGALNHGESMFANGSVEGINFTVCAVGTDVVILASNFERVQVIPGSCYGNESALVSCVNCCVDSGKIAAAYGSIIRIFEPTHCDGLKAKHKLDYRWFETGTIQCKSAIADVLWNLEGLRLLVSTGSHLQLYQHRILSSYYSNGETKPAAVASVTFSITDDDNEEHQQQQQSKSQPPTTSVNWISVWQVQLSAPVKYVKYSPDGALFSTCGIDDQLVKIWYQDSESDDQSNITFNFIYLRHPAAVVGFEWRKTGRYMPRRCIGNVLITWCKDNTSRIWKETPSNDCALDMNCDTIDESSSAGDVGTINRLKSPHRNVRIRNARHKILHRLKHLVTIKNKRATKKHHDGDVVVPILLRTPSALIGSSGSSLLDVSSTGCCSFTRHFHLAATINAETDCFLVPSMDTKTAIDKPFAVHWLNNKELMFSLGAEKLLADALIAEQRLLPRGSIESLDDLNHKPICSFSTPLSMDNGDDIPVVSVEGVPISTSNTVGRSVSSSSSDHVNKDILDMKMEGLLRQWLRTNDVLFTVHPVDGSLLIWTLEWLDDMSRMPTVSFSSRIPSAFPLTDAASLNPTLHTFNPHDPIYVEVLHRNIDENDVAKESKRSVANTLFLLTSHENGSLNLWHLSMEDNSNFTIILNISHQSRMCGHRFQISQVVGHSVLPLLLTASQYDNGKKAIGGNSTTMVGECSSELILWKISPVGPLCKSGGVRELARVTSTHSRRAFSCIAWIPAILPSSTLGSVCNSPSSCFVANDGRRLRVYQAVIDARALLAEIYAGSHARTTTSSRSSSSSTSGHEDESDLRTSSHIPWHEAFNVVSTQSTAKPGCVLQLAEINDTDNENMENVLLLHIFYERLIVAEDSMRLLGSESSRRIDAIVVDRSKSSVFADRYYIVLLKKTAANGTVLDMWSLDIASQPPHPINNARSNKSESRIDSSDNYYPSASPATPSAAQLYIGSEKICSQILALPEDVQVLSAVPAAGHLSSSSFYPACRAPYLLMTACTDDHVRFWRCLRTTNDVYQWQQWRMISNSVDSALEMDGMLTVRQAYISSTNDNSGNVFAVSAAHSSRFACAYERAGYVQKQPGHHHQNTEVAVFECESSGGVEWTREDTLPLKDNIVLASRQHHDEVEHNHHDTKRSITSPPKRIRIDWVSTENGSHLLTLNVGALVLFYAQVSQDMAQRNIVMMKEHDTHKRPALRKASSIATQRHSIAAARLVRWLCIRSLHLHSADGLPPLPTALTWVRDGLLIIGMQSEMRCYNQWNLQTIADNCTIMVDSHNPVVKRATLAVKPAALTFSPSHSMLDALRRDPSVQPPLMLMRKDKGDFASRTALQDTVRARDNRLVLEAVSDEGMFEAARLASPMLPQYHPKQLIELLNAGKNRRVKAILLHVLRCIRERCTSTSWSTAGAPTGIPNAMLARASSIRRMVSADESSNSLLSGAAAATIDDTTLDYFELESIPPLPLHALIAADSSSSVAIANSAVETDSGVGLVAGSPQTTSQYDSLFNDTPAGGADDLDAMLVDDEDENGQPISRSRHASTSSDHVSGSGGEIRNTVFTARHNRALTDFLTHMHLPGLSSVDQMHLLAVADTLSHFSSDIMDKLAQANAAMQPVTSSVINEATSGYATAGAGADTVDECGLRFLMAMKQHEYLLRCLPLKQRQALRTSGIAPSHIIWALHSETETELLNAIPGLQKSQPMWDELRSLGVGWWLLKNTTALRTCVEKMAKTAFQQHQNPLDAALFYLALRKKNVLTHLFRSARDERLSDFFAQDFSEERWRKAALKNAFLLMSKQRFHHAAAFFILGESLNDAIQVVLHNLNDLQLVLVIVRLYETDADRQTTLLRELLCRNILGIEVADLEANTSTADDDGMLESRALSASASPDPFIRSMAYWLLKEYSQAAATLLDEATRYHTGSNATSSSTMNEWTLSNIFNFYSFLRKHPLVIRQRLSDAHVQIGSTEKFLAAARRLESHVTPSERRLFFRTASAHLASGCPLLALDVLSRLPKALSSVAVAGSSTMSSLVDIVDGGASVKVDWSEPTNVIKEDKLELEWSDEDENKTPIVPPTTTTTAVVAGPLDVMAQHLKFVAVLRILTEELATFATGFEVDGGQLRYQLFSWLEREVQVLRYICDYQPNDPSDSDDASMMDDDEIDDQTTTDKRGSSDGETAMMLHEALRTDRLDLVARIRAAVHRRRWLATNQKLIRSLNSYCALHSSHSVGLVSAQMELSLLLLEVQQEPNIRQLIAPVPDVNSFPLLVASVASSKMFVLSPLHYLENQASDLLLTIAEMTVPPRMDNSFALAKVYMLYSLCQGLSSCVYQSLSDVDNFIGPKSHTAAAAGVLTRRARRHSSSAPDNMFDTTVTTAPSRWPGVDNIVALLSRGDMHGDETPTSPLRLLLAECTVAVYTALFAYALAACDSRWLYRLSTHAFDARQFAAVFGGGGEKRLSAAKSGPSIVRQQQQRPNRPPPVKLPPTGLNVGQRAGAVVDSAALRAKFHAKVFGNESPISVSAGSGSTALSERTVMRFVSPKLNLVQFFASKPAIRSREELGVDYDSDESVADDNENSDENQQHHDDDDDGVDVDDADDEMQMRRRQHSDPNSYAWAIMRLALVKQLIYRLRQFLVLIGFEINELTSTAPRIDLVMKLLDSWTETLDADVRSAAIDGCPKNFIPHSSLDQSNNNVGLSLWKYRTIIEPGNSPFNVDDATSLPVRRLWTYLVRQEHLMDIFIRHIFGSSQKSVVERSAQTSDEHKSNGTRASATPPLETFKIVQRELEAVVAFAVSQINPGWIVVSTGRELQEMDISALLTNAATDARWLTNPTELDIALADMRKDTLKDNDDYQLLLEREQRKQISASFLLKRQVTGIRRMDAHPSLPYYVSGSSDGSIRLWEWGVGQPLYTPRPVGQYAKVTKVAFSANGNKFAAVDGDGLLCLWQASHGNPIRKPFFNQKCHTKSAADVRFLGATSSLLVTAGHGSGDQNLALWDTLLPSSKAMIHTWNCHPEGANCCMYVPTQQTIVSGGRHGELCFWDVRMRALRTQLKVFDNAAAVKTLIADPGYEMFVVASSDGDIKIWSIESAPQLLYTLNGEHGTRSGFSLRTVAGGAGIQGVQQIYVDNRLRMFSCGADCSLKLRQLPSMFG